MSGDSDHPVPLPAKDFCNSWGKGNPVLGKGALGNSFREKMYYQGGDREALVTMVQLMLTDLGYDVGSKGADGKFGDETEKAVKTFQKDHKDWDGNSLKVDGLVGPETGDALNRKMVGMWYDSYITPKELTKEHMLVTIFSDKLKESFEIRKEGKKKIKLILVGEGIKDKNLVELKLKLITFFLKVKKYHYRLEIDDPNFTAVEGDTDESGLLTETIPRNAKTGRLIVDNTMISLIIIGDDFEPANTAVGAFKRLASLGYCDFITSLSSESLNDIKDENQLIEIITGPLIAFQYDHELEPNGNLNLETIQKLENIYGN